MRNFISGLSPRDALNALTPDRERSEEEVLADIRKLQRDDGTLANGDMTWKQLYELDRVLWKKTPSEMKSASELPKTVNDFAFKVAGLADCTPDTKFSLKEPVLGVLVGDAMSLDVLEVRPERFRFKLYAHDGISGHERTAHAIVSDLERIHDVFIDSPAPHAAQAPMRLAPQPV